MGKETGRKGHLVGRLEMAGLGRLRDHHGQGEVSKDTRKELCQPEEQIVTTTFHH